MYTSHILTTCTLLSVQARVKFIIYGLTKDGVESHICMLWLSVEWLQICNDISSLVVTHNLKSTTVIRTVGSTKLLGPSYREYVIYLRIILYVERIGSACWQNTLECENPILKMKCLAK